jgi:aldose 1-epimerase
MPLRCRTTFGRGRPVRAASAGRVKSPSPTSAFVLAALLSLCLAAPASAQYSARREGDVVRLEDTRTQTVVSIATSLGDMVFEMKVKGHEILHFPYASLDDFRKRPGLAGVPLLAPWANRLDEQAFYANGKKYAFDMELGNVRGAHPSHGFLSRAPQWEVVEVNADAKAAWVTSRLEFFRQPDWMAQFPFAHTLEITYRLERGVLEVGARINNLSGAPMPVAIGFHPFFKLTDAPRDEWTVSIGARTEWRLAPDKLPTGETRPIEQLLPNPQAAVLKPLDLDHVFGDLIRDGSGRSVTSIKGKSQQIDVAMGPNYRAAVVFAPAGREFICVEPMAGITNALNLAHRGVYKELQSIVPDGTWEERFWIRPAGF